MKISQISECKRMKKKNKEDKSNEIYILCQSMYIYVYMYVYVYLKREQGRCVAV